MVPNIIKFFRGGKNKPNVSDPYSHYGSHTAAKFAYDAGSRHPEAINAAIPTHNNEPMTIASNTKVSLSNVNNNPNHSVSHDITTTYGNGIYDNFHESESTNNGYYKHHNIGMNNGDRYHEYTNGDNTSYYYERDFGRDLGMKNLPKPKELHLF